MELGEKIMDSINTILQKLQGLALTQLDVGKKGHKFLVLMS